MKTDIILKAYKRFSVREKIFLFLAIASVILLLIACVDFFLEWHFYKYWKFWGMKYPEYPGWLSNADQWYLMRSRLRLGDGFCTFLRIVTFFSFCGFAFHTFFPPLIRVVAFLGAILYNPFIRILIESNTVWVVYHMISLLAFTAGLIYLFYTAWRSCDGTESTR